MYLQLMIIPPKRFDIFSPWLGDAQKVQVRSGFSLNNCHRTMYLQPMVPPKRFDIISPWLGDAQKVYVRSDFSLNKCHRTMYLQPMIPPKRFDMFSPRRLVDAQKV